MILEYLEFINERYSEHHFVVSNDKITEGEYKLMRRKGLKKTENYLNENYLGFVKLESQFDRYLFNVAKWKVDKNFLLLYFKGYFVNGDYNEVYRYDSVPLKDFGSITKIKTREPMRKPEIDPFGEEFWYE